VIHGQHHIETMACLARFPDVPAIYVSHGWMPWQEHPPRHPRIRHYVAVDDLVRDRLVVESGIEPERLSLLYNFVDLERFPRRGALPARPRRALVFNSHATEENFGAFAREACARVGIDVTLVGYGSGRWVSDPGALLRGYDLVFARARSALEAMACGCAVIVADPRGLGGMVTSENAAALRRRNFGFSTFVEPLSVEAIARLLRQYDAADAGRVCDFIRGDAGMSRVVDAYEELYARVTAAPCAIEPDAERDAMIVYLQWLTTQPKIPGLCEWSELKQVNGALQLSIDALNARLAAAARELEEERGARKLSAPEQGPESA
jgi:hypothetical protein